MRAGSCKLLGPVAGLGFSHKKLTLRRVVRTRHHVNSKYLSKIHTYHIENLSFRHKVFRKTSYEEAKQAKDTPSMFWPD